jgi:hypothetical protein
MSSPGQEPFNDWHATNVKHLREMWRGLRPDSDEESLERTFAGRRLTPDQAGLVFERWITEAFRLSGATGCHAFTVAMRETGQTREQIDGLIFDGWQAFLLESKFWLKGVDFGPIAVLHTLLDTRPTGTMGLFFSAFDYTRPALENTEMLRPHRVLLFNAGNLEWALNGGKSFKGRMMEMVRRKWMLTTRLLRADLPIQLPLDLFS